MTYYGNIQFGTIQVHGTVGISVEPALSRSLWKQQPVERTPYNNPNHYHTPTYSNSTYYHTPTYSNSVIIPNGYVSYRPPAPEAHYESYVTSNGMGGYTEHGNVTFGASRPSYHYF